MVSKAKRSRKSLRDKCVCANCGWHGLRSNLLEARHPFIPRDVVVGCPSCFEVDTIRKACEFPRCHEEVTCGGLDADDVYRSTCGKHASWWVRKGAWA